ncbi:flippase [Ectobacillus panaciterrae]|uniref:flippase n=1 Tax=Ectobacillus panaciterrae TaxID=363872 RepID=UPI00042A7878|nr:flippase [Ectobacillus panaciterrae]
MSTKRKLFSNFLSLAILQGLNYILPLLTVPYLTRVLGSTSQGLIFTGQAMNVIFVTVTDYGFNLMATKQIAIARDDKEQIRRIHSTVLTVKLLLMVISFLVLLGICLIVPKYNEHFVFYVLFFGITVGTVLFPVYLFQGMEEMKYITILNVISKTIFTVGIFVFIRDKGDLMYSPILLSAGYITVGVISLFMVRYKFGIKWISPKLTDVKYQLRQGWSVFVSNAAVSAFTAGNTVLLGLFANQKQVFYYGGAEKLINAAVSVVNPVAGALFPHISSLAHESKEQAVQFLRKSLWAVLLVTVPITVVTIVLAEFIVTIFYGFHYEQVVLALRILSFLPIIIGLNNLFGVQTMITFGYEKAFMRIMLITVIINLVLTVFLVPQYGYVGTAIAVLLTELSITVREYVFLRRQGIRIL